MLIWGDFGGWDNHSSLMSERAARQTSTRVECLMVSVLKMLIKYNFVKFKQIKPLTYVPF